MKKSKLLTLAALATVMTTISSCKKDEHLNASTSSESETVDYIKSLGYSDSQIQDIGSEYLVDGDILFPKNLELPKHGKSAGKTSQYGTGYYITGNLILIKIDPSMNGYISEIQSAIQQWNNIANSRLTFQIYDEVHGTPNVTITNANLGNGVCGAAYFPYNGNPGSLVRINTQVIQNNSFEQRQRTIAHEIGHAIGMRHTNWFNNYETQTGYDEAGHPASAVNIPGTPTGEDSNSLMNGGQCGSGATILSLYDKAFVEYVYPKYTNAAPIYRLYDSSTEHRLVTCNPNEIRALAEAGWNIEGHMGFLYTSQQPGSIPVYRFYNPGSSDHYYSTDSATPSGYQFEEILGYAPSTPTDLTRPLYQYFKPGFAHLYTEDYNTQTYGSIGYNYEKIAFFMLPKNTTNETEGHFVRDDATGRAFIGMEGKIRHIQSGTTLFSIFDFDYPMLESYPNVNQFTIGTPITPDCSLINDVNSGKVYFREGNVIRHIFTAGSFNRYHFKWSAIKNVSNISSYTVGPPIY